MKNLIFFLLLIASVSLYAQGEVLTLGGKQIGAGAIPGQALVWDGTNWGPASVSGGSIGPNSLDSSHIKDKSIRLLELNQSGATIGQVPVWNGTKWIASTSSTTRLNYFTPEDFGAKADYKSFTGSVTSGTSTITCTGCFSPSDTGKLVTVPWSRIDAPYNPSRRVTMNTKIISVTNANTAIVDSIFSATVTNVRCQYGSNNYEEFKALFDSLAASQIKTVVLSAGKYYIVPTKSIPVSTTGISISGSVHIIGQGQGISCLKIGEEHTQRIGISPKTNGIFLSGNGEKIFNDFSIYSADTISTEFVPGTDAFFTSQLSGQIMKIRLQNVTIGYDWGGAFSSSRGGTSSVPFSCTFISDTIAGKAQPITIFSQDGPYKEIIASRCNIIGGGQAASQTILSAASITSGTKIVTVSTPGFSFYDRSDPSNGRFWNLTINSTFFGRITSITNCSTAIVTNTAVSTITNGTLVMNYETDGYFGHAMYIHPNVKIDIRDCDFWGGNDISIYSGGGVTGINKGFRFENINLNSKQNIGFHPGYVTNLGPFATGGYMYWKNCPYFSQNSTYLNKIVSEGFCSTSAYYGDTVRLINPIEIGTNSGKTIRILSTGQVEIIGGVITTLDINATGRAIIKDFSTTGSVNSLVITGAGFMQLSNCNIGAVQTWFTPTGSQLIQFDNCRIGINQWVNNQRSPAFAPLNSLTSAQQTLYRGTFVFNNCTFGGTYTSNISSNFPAGMLPTNKGAFVGNGGFIALANDIDTLRRLNFLPSEILACSLKNEVNYLQYNESATVINHILYNAHAFSGNVKLMCYDTFLLSPGIDVRLLNHRKRKIGEIIDFEIDGRRAIWQEKGSNEKTLSATIPTRTGLLGEVVLSSSYSGAGWKYVAAIISTIKTKSASGLVLPVLDTMPNKLTLGYDFADRYVSPDTMLTVTVPTSLGTEVFRVNKFGQLVGANGGTGFINPRTKIIKISTLGSSATLNTAGTITTAYKYLSGGNWQYFDDRKIKSSFVLDFPSTAPLTSVTLTQTITGVTTQDAISFQPVGGVPSNSIYTAWVSGPDTVTISFANLNAVSIDPPSATYNVIVNKY